MCVDVRIHIWGISLFGVFFSFFLFEINQFQGQILKISFQLHNNQGYDCRISNLSPFINALLFEKVQIKNHRGS